MAFYSLKARITLKMRKIKLFDIYNVEPRGKYGGTEPVVLKERF